MSVILTFMEGLLSGVIITTFWFRFTRSNNLNVSQEEENVNYDKYGNDSELGTNKLILVVRNDLKMGKGKVAAQCSHAAVLAHELSRKKSPKIFANWKRSGQPKIVLKIDSEEEMHDLAKEARKQQLLVNIVKDAGRTQVPSGSETVLAVGPGPECLINQVTSHLKLY